VPQCAPGHHEAMLQQDYLSVLEARDRETFRDAVVRFTQQLGFQTVSAMTVVDRGRGEADFITVDNTPSGFEEIFRDSSQGQHDPVMQHCKRHSRPIMWDQTTYVKGGVGEMWEEQAQFGLRSGVAMALHLPEGKHFFLGVDRPDPLPTQAGALTRLVADLQLFAVHAQEAALRVLLPPALVPEMPALTPRELEVLRWTMDGKTAWEVGNILGITERTAVLHANNAMHKLGCATKHQAVLKALRLGLIH
jgi:DNA-binding CsgD family transcriptional regulator